MTIDLTLDAIKIPALPYYEPPFGTKKLSGGLTTEEVNANIIAGFVRQRPVIITENSATASGKQVEYNCSLVLNAASLLIEVGAAAYAGCTCKVLFPYGGQFKYTGKTGVVTDTLRAGASVVYMWMGSWWEAQIGKCAIGDVLMQMPDVDAPGLIYGGQWEEHPYAGMFFRSQGGNAKAFTTPVTPTWTNGTTFTVSSADADKIATGDLAIHGTEYRTITKNGTTMTLDSAFTDFSNITNLLIGQPDLFAQHNHSITGSILMANNQQSGNYMPQATSWSSTNSNMEIKGIGANNRGGVETRSKNITVRNWLRIA